MLHSLQPAALPCQINTTFSQTLLLQYLLAAVAPVKPNALLALLYSEMDEA